MLDALEDPSFPLALAALVHLLDDGPLLAGIGERLKLANAEIERAGWLAAHWQQLRDAQSLYWPRLQRLLVHPGGHDLVDLAAARAAAGVQSLADVEFCRRKLELPEAELNPPPLITGKDLINHGLSPGPEFQVLLNRVRDCAIRRSHPRAVRCAGAGRSAARQFGARLTRGATAQNSGAKPICRRQVESCPR